MTLIFSWTPECIRWAHAFKISVSLEAQNFGFPFTFYQNSRFESSLGFEQQETTVNEQIRAHQKNIQKSEESGANMQSRRRASDSTDHIDGCFEIEGERLASLLQSINKRIGLARHVDGKSLPEKFWLKQQFSIGVNDVTRVLERMKPNPEMGTHSAICKPRASSSVQLQAVLLASDCKPWWLTKHLPSLAMSRKVPLIFVKDNNGASLRLGELVKLKTAIAIGIKAKGNSINQLLVEILEENSSQHCNDLMNLGTDGLNSTEMEPLI